MMIIRTLALSVVIAAGLFAQNKSMKQHAAGTFEVQLKPLSASPDEFPGRMSIDKEFKGDLTGTSKGQMLAAMTAVKGSAGYVAIEKVTGSLQGRTGSFILQHSGLATSKDQKLTIVVIPDSGTGELTGIAGTLNIKIEGGKHYYEFDYTLP